MNVKIGDVIMHGDVLLHCEELPCDFFEMKELRDGVLALGEQTNHRHILENSFDLRESENKTKYLKLVEPSSLSHEEHATIVIPPGTYRIGIQREYDHFEKITREVAD